MEKIGILIKKFYEDIKELDISKETRETMLIEFTKEALLSSRYNHYSVKEWKGKE